MSLIALQWMGILQSLVGFQMSMTMQDEFDSKGAKNLFPPTGEKWIDEKQKKALKKYE